MWTAIQKYFSKENLLKRSFRNREQRLNNLFLKTEPIRRRFLKLSQQHSSQQQEIDDFLSENADLNLQSQNISHKMLMENAKTLKTTAIVLDTLCSVGGVGFFFRQISDIALMPPLMRLVFILSATILTAMTVISLGVKIQNLDEVAKRKSWKRYLYLLPTALLMCLNLFVAYNKSGQIFWLFALLAIFGFGIYFKVMENYRELTLAKSLETAQRNLNSKIKNIKKTETKLEQLNIKMQPIITSIKQEAFELRGEYESYETTERPKLRLPIPYIYILNNRIFYDDVFEVSQSKITQPKGSALTQYQIFWEGINKTEDNDASVPALIVEQKDIDISDVVTNV